MIKPNIQKIKLSSCVNRQQALDLIANRLSAMHRLKSVQLPQHGIFINKDTEMMANALQFYLDGGSVDLLNEAKIVLDPHYRFSDHFLTELREELFENDLSPAEFEKLPPDHPYKLLVKLIEINDPQSKITKAAKQNTLTYAHTMMLELIARMQHVDEADFNVHQDAFVYGNMLMLREGYYFHKEGNKVYVESFDEMPVLNEKEGLKEATEMHELMVRQTRYRDTLERSFVDFVKNPSADANTLVKRAQKNRPQIPDAKRPKVSVVGLGPAGAFAAIRAYQEGAIVTGIEKRETYSRNNVFRLTPDMANELVNLFVDKIEDVQTLSPDHPLRKIVEMKSLSEKKPSPLGEFYTITIKDFEYLVNLWLDVVAKSDPQGLKIYRGYQYTPGCLSQGKNQIKITQGKSEISIPTDFLVAADGPRSNCRGDIDVDMETLSTSAVYSTFNYHPKRGSQAQLYASLLKSGPKKDIDMGLLKAMGWTRNRLPVTRYFNTGEHPYLGIEIPESLAQEYYQLSDQIDKLKKAGKDLEAYPFKIQRDNLIDQWGKATLQMFMTEKDTDELVLKDFAIFDVQLVHAVKSGVVHPNCTVFLMGDAVQNAHFQTGRGAIVGVKEANLIGKCVQQRIQGKQDPEILKEYDTSVKQLTLQLDELAFDFPTHEDLRVKPTAAFYAFKRQVEAGKQPQGASEAPAPQFRTPAHAAIALPRAPAVAAPRTPAVAPPRPVVPQRPTVTQPPAKPKVTQTQRKEAEAQRIMAEIQRKIAEARKMGQGPHKAQDISKKTGLARPKNKK